MTPPASPGTDYEPIDLSSWCNAGWEALGDPTPTKRGAVILRGLPFVLGGSAPEQALVMLDASLPQVNVDIGRRARFVIIAHRQLARRHGMWSVGDEAARYRLVFGDGSVHEAAIRERFEIQAIDAGWGQLPFLAVPDQEDSLQPRYEGPWGASGFRQCECEQGFPEAFYLWAWPVPRPQVPIERLELVAGITPVAVVGVTLGHLDEEPFGRSPRSEARVVLIDSSRAERPFGLAVEVDRGVATYPHLLPPEDPAEFCEGPFVDAGFPGWGQTQREGSSPSYVEIAASPSATVSVLQDGETVGSVRWADVCERGAAEQDGIRVELVDKGRNWVHVTVLDDVTGEPVPCRVHFRSPEGVPYQPHGHHQQLNSNLGTWHIDVGGDLRLGQITYAYIDGTCQGWLPRGEVVVDAARGFEYEPLRTTVRVEPGQRELTLRLRRWVNLAEEGWYSGDSHVHFLSTQGSLLEQQAEDLNVVNLLQSQWGALFTNTEDFTGQTARLADRPYLTHVSQENRQHLLGHLTLWGLRRPVMPWCSDGPSEAELGGSLEVTLSDWADQCHAQGGTVILPHFPNPNGEPATLIATGRADAVEMLQLLPAAHEEYYRYLNCGYRLPLVGGTDKMTGDVPVGLYRTYAHVGLNEPFSHEAWSRAVRAGRTFLSGGPILRLEVDGHEVGDTVVLSGPGTVEVHAWAESTIPLHSLELVQQGKVVAQAIDAKGTRRLELREQVKVDGHSWLAARCGGPGGPTARFPHHLDGWHRAVFAHTSPVYLQCGPDDWALYDEEVARYMTTLIQGSLTHVRSRARRYPPDSVTHHHGRSDHEAYLEEPFLAALHSLEQRVQASR